VRDLLRSYSGDAIRLYLVSRHYRSEVSFTEADLEAAAATAAKLRRACVRAEELSPAHAANADPAGLCSAVAEHRERFLAAMDDDLDTPRAIPQLTELADLALGADDLEVAAQAGWMVRELGARILGLRLAAAPVSARSTTAV